MKVESNHIEIIHKLQNKVLIDFLLTEGIYDK